ncbi:MAG: hypothetical protein IPM79_21640 [Polyangiaceae bacterium]|jgi:3-oxoacyl-[acyl-carrier-protein] synthase-1|nr:hypothetical protein [Polyangiaceae bacterium]
MTVGAVISVGARTPFGLDAWQSSMMWRAGKLAPRPTELLDARGRRIGSMRARFLPDTLFGTPRLIALAVPALREAVSAAGARVSSPPPVLLATAEPRPGFEDTGGRGLISEIAHQAKVEIDLGRSQVVQIGHAGFSLVLQRAASLLSGARGSVVVVGGVDTYHHPSTLAWLDEERRLHADGTDNGLIPSEGAAFLVLGSGTREILAHVRSVACALEEGSEVGPEPDLGKALVDVVKRSVEPATQKPVPWVLTDGNGERHRIRRWSFASVRANDVVGPGTSELLEAGDELGDMGAAVGAMLAVHAAVGFASGAVEHGSALVALSSEGPERGAFLMEAPE